MPFKGTIDHDGLLAEMREVIENTSNQPAQTALRMAIVHVEQLKADNDRLRESLRDNIARRAVGEKALSQIVELIDLTHDDPGAVHDLAYNAITKMNWKAE